MAIRSARIWSSFGMAFWVLGFGGLSLLAIEFLYLFIVGSVLYLIVLRPTPWR